MEVIQAKLQGVEIEEAPVAAPTKVGDLMAALRASVDAAKKRKEEPVPPSRESKPARKRRRATCRRSSRMRSTAATRPKTTSL